MSHSTVYGLWPGTEQRVKLAEFQNAWGMAPVIWDALTQKHFGAPPNGWFGHAHKLWALAGQPDFSKTDRAVLRMTFDTCYILNADTTQAIQDIALFLYGHQAFINPTAVNHWPAYASVLLNHRGDSGPPAFGVWQTSVSDNTWDGPYDEELDKRLPFDWGLAENVYEELQ